MSYTIRKAEKRDLPRIHEIYAIARQFMRDNGNHAQWGEGDRPEELLEDDIRQGNLYVLEEGMNGEDTDNAENIMSEKIHAVFVFAEGPDPVYKRIEQGSWKSDTEYSVVHRVASDGTVRNVLGQIMDYCKAQISHLRIDTHENNKVMQHVLEKCEFERCGIVQVPDGSPRIAYEWIRK